MDILSQLMDTANWLDKQHNSDIYSTAITEQLNNIKQPENLPSSKVAKLDNNFQNEMLKISQQHSDYFRNHTIPKQVFNKLQCQAKKSIKMQHDLENQDKEISFQDFYENYQSQATNFLQQLHVTE